jgi:hypothetical protein
LAGRFALLAHGSFHAGQNALFRIDGLGFEERLEVDFSGYCTSGLAGGFFAATFCCACFTTQSRRFLSAGRFPDFAGGFVNGPAKECCGLSIMYLPFNVLPKVSEAKGFPFCERCETLREVRVNVAYLAC